MIKTHPPDKETLLNNLNGLSVAYINHEGVELPLKSVKDFDEAIKSAKWSGKNHLNLIFYDKQLKPNEINYLNSNKSAIIGRFSENEGIARPFRDKEFNNFCQCIEDPLPEWSTQFKKKFKKEHLKDLKSIVSEMVHEEFKKKLAEGKPFKPTPEKNEFSSPVKMKKKKKVSDKDALDLLEKREIKLLKRIEKLFNPDINSEKLESKAKVFVEEKRKSSDKGSQNKSKDAKKMQELQKKCRKNVDINVKNENFKTKKIEVESESDSELSVIFMSEEDENFTFVSSLSESLNSVNSNKVTKLRDLDLKQGYEFNLRPNNITLVEEHDLKTKPKKAGSEKISTAEDCLSSHICPNAGTKPSNNKIFSNNMKPSFESFTASTNKEDTGSKESLKNNISAHVSFEVFDNPNFPHKNATFNVLSNDSPYLYSKKERSSSTETEFGEKRNNNHNASQNFAYSTQVFCSLQDLKKKNTAEKDYSNKNVPTSDSVGKPIYAVRGDGFCIPVKDMIHCKVEFMDAVKVLNLKEEKENETKEETHKNFKGNEGSTIPNPLLNGATVVASAAFNTAKFVFNNLQSVLKPEVETMPKDMKNHDQNSKSLNEFPYNLYFMEAEERNYLKTLPDKKKYIDAMLTLDEMGFVNYKLNFHLLKKYDNRVSDVITELLDTAVKEAP